MFYKGFQLCEVSNQRIAPQRTACAVPRNSCNRAQVNRANQPIGRLPLTVTDRLLHAAELADHRVTLVHQLGQGPLLLLLNHFPLTQYGLIFESKCLHDKPHQKESSKSMKTDSAITT